MVYGCCLVHNWKPATCTTAQICSKCGETEGEALGHSWTEEGFSTVNYNGIDYDKCTNDYEHIGGSYDFALSHVEYIFYVRVPVGYDGTVFAFYDWNVSTAMEAEDACINECANENTVYFRINGDAYSGTNVQSSEEQDSSSEEAEDESGCSIPDAVFIEEGVYYVEGLGYVDEEGQLIYYEDPNQYAQIEEGIGNDREDVPRIDEADDLKNWISQGHFNIDSIDEVEVVWLNESEWVYFDGIAANVVVTVTSGENTYTVWIATVYVEGDGIDDDQYWVLDVKKEQ